MAAVTLDTIGLPGARTCPLSWMGAAVGAALAILSEAAAKSEATVNQRLKAMLERRKDMTCAQLGKRHPLRSQLSSLSCV